MKNILVPTDYSQNARAVALWAASLAQQVQARLVLLHVLPLIRLEEEVSAEEKAQGLLDAAAHELYTRSRISVTRLLTPGLAIEEIPRIAEQLNADIILMGAKGVGNDASLQLGRVAFELLKSHALPVLCLPFKEGVMVSGEDHLPLQIDLRLCNAKALWLMQNKAATIFAQSMGVKAADARQL